MHNTPELLTGTTIDWQRLHRGTRIELGEKLVGREIAYRTYSMLTEPNSDVKYLRITDIDDTERRGVGRVRIFLGYNRDNVFVVLPWSRIVEVILL